MEYRYTIDSSESIYTDFLLKVSDRLSAYAEYERDIYNGQVIEYGLGFLYETQCWSLDFHLIKDESDYEYQFMIKLFGIGDIGQ